MTINIASTFDRMVLLAIVDLWPRFDFLNLLLSNHAMSAINLRQVFFDSHGPRHGVAPVSESFQPKFQTLFTSTSFCRWWCKQTFTVNAIYTLITLNCWQLANCMLNDHTPRFNWHAVLFHLDENVRMLNSVIVFNKKVRYTFRARMGSIKTT